MEPIRLTIFSAKILIEFWLLDAVIAEWLLNTKVMPSTNEFFSDIIRESKSALFLLILFLNVALNLCCSNNS